MFQTSRSPPRTGACDELLALVAPSMLVVRVALAARDGPGCRCGGSGGVLDLRAARAADPEGALLPVPRRAGEAEGEARPPPSPPVAARGPLGPGDRPRPARGEPALGADRGRRDAARRKEA